MDVDGVTRIVLLTVVVEEQYAVRDGLGSHDADVASALRCVRERGFWQVPKTYLDISRHRSDQVVQWDHVGREKGCAVKHSFYHLHVEAVVADNPGPEM